MKLKADYIRDILLKVRLFENHEKSRKTLLYILTVPTKLYASQGTLCTSYHDQFNQSPLFSVTLIWLRGTITFFFKRTSCAFTVEHKKYRNLDKV